MSKEKEDKIIVKWKTLGGKYYEGELIDIDNGTGIVKLIDGNEIAVHLEGLIIDGDKVVIDNQTTFVATK